jgi:aspartyl-tRNA(Asn)/glutamyl-tRNA(Gln) amidotransferase subunit A
MYLSDVMTVGASLAGIPAIVIPAGAADSLPVGLQIMAAQKQDKTLLQTAYNAQKELQK